MLQLLYHLTKLPSVSKLTVLKDKPSRSLDNNSGKTWMVDELKGNLERRIESSDLTNHIEGNTIVFCNLLQYAEFS